MKQKGSLPQEIEIKLDLESFANYLKLTGFLGEIDREVHQQNCFFDSEDRQVAEAGWALRVRVENDRGLVTVKSRIAQPGVAVIREEIEEEIPRSMAVEIVELRKDIMTLNVEPIRHLRKQLPQLHLSRLVCFDNRRQEKSFRIGDYDYLLEIDITSFSDGSTDYELEIELPHIDRLDVVEQSLRRMFASLDIPFERQDMSKFQRALERAHLV